ncbi:hypothetical protein [Thermomonospora amylolytica]|uniref:hypothetical protein n=1 Tax=Thermomonospora amylolytica TaxID=1411117 RepID=UPI000E6B811B|nr:hypothetical protein [Thermomonospora amylolytica]
MADTTLTRWQDPDDGYPTPAYWDAVTTALTAAGIGLADATDEGDGYSYRLTDEDSARIGYPKVYIAWDVDERLEDGEFVGYGWCWIAYDSADAWKGSRVERFDLPYLADPEKVARAVADLITDGGGRG